MDPKEVIETYVDDIVLRLPIGVRKDIGIELRDLLNEELANKSAEAGRAPDSAMARALIKDFGAVDEVAARYQPAGITAIPAREGRLLASLALGSVLAQWALSIPLQVVLPTDGDFLSRLGAWSVGSGLHAFALPGVAAMCLIAFAWWRHVVTKSDTVTLAFFGDLPPLPALEPSRVNRLAWGAALIGFAIGIPLYAATPEIITRLPDPAPQVFALDETFVRERGPWLLAVWIAQLALFLVVLVEGRWRALTRRAEMALNLAGAAMVTWFIFGGPMFVSAETDGYAKQVMGLIVFLILVVTAVRVWREQARVGDAAPTT